jgi:CRP-like cAMP-binding protein
VARTDCRLAALDQRQFTFLVDEIPFFALRVMKVLADRLRKADRFKSSSEVPPWDRINREKRGEKFACGY